MTILEEAAFVVGNRQTSYGSREDNFGRIAMLWTAILGCEVAATDVALCMIAMKLAREKFTHSRDNIADVIGYALCLADLLEEE